MKRKIISILVVILTFTVLFCLTACTQEEETPEYIEGAFYSLQEAYDNGWITEENLQSIADLYHNKQTAPEIDISEAVSYSIRKTFADEWKASVSDVSYKYYGEYNDCFAVKVSAKDMVVTTSIDIVTIGNVSITYTDGGRIKIWKEAKGEFFSLQNAYDKGWISSENLQSVAELYNAKNTAENNLSEVISTAIKNDYAVKINTSVDNVSYDFYGEYNGCIAVMMFSSTEEFPDIMTDATVGEVTIHYTDGNKILIWKQ